MNLLRIGPQPIRIANAPAKFLVLLDGYGPRYDDKHPEGKRIGDAHPYEPNKNARLYVSSANAEIERANQTYGLKLKLISSGVADLLLRICAVSWMGNLQHVPFPVDKIIGFQAPWRRLGRELVYRHPDAPVVIMPVPKEFRWLKGINAALTVESLSMQDFRISGDGTVEIDVKPERVSLVPGFPKKSGLYLEGHGEFVRVHERTEGIKDISRTEGAYVGYVVRDNCVFDENKIMILLNGSATDRFCLLAEASQRDIEIIRSLPRTAFEILARNLP